MCLALQRCWIYKPLNLCFWWFRCCWCSSSPSKSQDCFFSSLFTCLKNSIDNPSTTLTQVHHLADGGATPLELEFLLFLSIGFVQQTQDLPHIWSLRGTRSSTSSHIFHERIINDWVTWGNPSSLKYLFIIYLFYSYLFPMFYYYLSICQNGELIASETLVIESESFWISHISFPRLWCSLAAYHHSCWKPWSWSLSEASIPGTPLP